MSGALEGSHREEAGGAVFDMGHPGVGGTTFLWNDLSSLEFALLIYGRLQGMVCEAW